MILKMMLKLSLKNYCILFLFFLVNSCSNVTTKTERFDKDRLKYPDIKEYELRRRLKNEGKNTFIGNLFGKEKSNKNGVAVNSNINPFLWKASLDVLSSSMPLTSIDRMSGIIISDWYNLKGRANERVKITVLIQSKDLKSDGLKVEIFKQINRANSWQSAKIDPSIALALERKIIQKAGFLSSQVD